VNPVNVDAEVGGQAQFGATMETESCYGLVSPPSQTYLTGWISSNTASATVDDSGFATAMSPGTAFMSVSWMNTFWTANSNHTCNVIENPGSGSGEMIVTPTFTLNVPATAKDGDTVTFSITPQDGTPTSIQWSFEAPSGAGNNPQVNFSSPTSASTTAMAHWFAKPNDACTASFDSRYTIKARVTFQNGSPKTKEKYFTVNAYWFPAGSVNPPNITGDPQIRFDSVRNLWIVVGPGTLQRVPNPAVINVPQTSQFYNKTVQHEQVHVEQYATGIFSDLYKISDLMPHLLPLTDPNQQPLEQKIFQAKQIWRIDQDRIMAQRLPDAEIEAHAVSDPIAPRYLYQNCP